MLKQNIGLALAFGLSLALGCNPNNIGNTNGDGGTDGGTGDPLQIPGCTGTCAVNYQCASQGMGPTTITGVVNIPAGNLPLYNAKVYIPTGASLPAAPASGASCDICDATPVGFSTNTNIDGSFTLANIPSGQNIPLIVQVGKWRRVVTLPPITDCTSTALDTTQTRLPRNQSEGNIPKIALATGGADALECLFRSGKLGIDDAEFTNPDGNGRINLFAGAGGANKYQTGNQAFPAADTAWWNDTTKNPFDPYDIVLFSCEGGQNAGAKQDVAHVNLHKYLNNGGRVFASHWHNIWISGAKQIPGMTTEPPLSVVANLENDGNGNSAYQIDDGSNKLIATINQSFPKGMALASWLQSAGASSQLGQVPIQFSRITLDKLNPKAAMYPNLLPTDWADVNTPANSPPLAKPASQYFSFTTPISAAPSAQCGEMVFTDMHVSGAGGCTANCPAKFDNSTTGTPFPMGCQATGGLSPQEKALIFLLFDLTNCIQPPIG